MVGMTTKRPAVDELGRTQRTHQNPCDSFENEDEDEHEHEDERHELLSRTLRHVRSDAGYSNLLITSQAAGHCVSDARKSAFIKRR